MNKTIKIIFLVLLGIGIQLFLAFAVVMCIIILDFGGLPKTNEEIHFDDIKEKTGVSFKKCKIISSIDTHSGFPADGSTKTIYQCGNKFDTTNIKKRWMKLPFTDNLNTELYGGTTKNGIQIPERDEKNYPIPKVENGYYYFIDQYSRYYKDLKDIYSDERLIGPPRYSRNFTLTVYDIDTNKLYYYELDT